MDETPNSATPHRRHGDDPSSSSHRLGVLWSADAQTARHKIWSTVLDISPDGARLRIDTVLLGQVGKFRLVVESLPPIECAPVWQANGRLGVRFLRGQPSMTQLTDLIDASPRQAALS